MSSICVICGKVDRKGEPCDLCPEEHCIHGVCSEDEERCNCGYVFSACFYCNMDRPYKDVEFFYGEESFDTMEDLMKVFDIGVKDAKEGRKAKFSDFTNDRYRALLAKEYMRGYSRF